jgi:hypothetical protein
VLTWKCTMDINMRMDMDMDMQQRHGHEDWQCSMYQ